jgi:hypothetical protein
MVWHPLPTFIARCVPPLVGAFADLFCDVLVQFVGSCPVGALNTQRCACRKCAVSDSEALAVVGGPVAKPDCSAYQSCTASYQNLSKLLKKNSRLLNPFFVCVFTVILVAANFKFDVRLRSALVQDEWHKG